MTEQKTKPTTKKVATAITGSKIAAKQKTTKARTATTAKQAVTKKPEAKKPAAKKPAAKTAAIKEKPATPQKKVTSPSPEERYRMVETAAYFIAEQHGFLGRTDEHWAEAEREIAAKLGK